MDVNQIRRIIAEQLAVPLERVTARAQFREDLGADSLDLVELTVAIEEHYDISVSDEEAIGCGSVADALRLLGPKIGEILACEV